MYSAFLHTDAGINLQPGVSDTEMETLVEEKVAIFRKGIQNSPLKKGQIIVTFSEKRPRKSWFQVYMGDEEVPWEQWVINAEVRQPRSENERQQANGNLTATLTRSIETMLSHTTSERGRNAVPQITTAAGISPFPLRITVKVGGIDVEGT
ncbi:hypothetical protein HGRIS_004134 [Hohenbuehelia grisea]|uniref:Autophagy-related protein 101 n=1 Tax=Hohenbuehelia grisea TaxID=104357 RepID=A0ABR3JHK3_9AGAR